MLCAGFQIRRYVYHDVIRLDDAAKLIDCAYVQVSTILQNLMLSTTEYIKKNIILMGKKTKKLTCDFVELARIRKLKMRENPCLKLSSFVQFTCVLL